jgi:hypothetical protein
MRPLPGERIQVRELELIATVIWAGTACFGLYLLFVWLSHGGLRQQATRITVFPAGLIFAHPVLASTGLTFWLVFLFTKHVTYALACWRHRPCSASSC